jgi:molybdate transport system regulatory protein
MPLSARNQLPGVIESIQIGDIMAHLVVKVGDNLIESVITRNSAEDLALKKGDSVKVVVKFQDSLRGDLLQRRPDPRSETSGRRPC